MDKGSSRVVSKHRRRKNNYTLRMLGVKEESFV